MRDELYPGRILAGYRLEKTVGRGGFAHVLRATRQTDGRVVALKLLRDEHREDARREAQLLGEGRLLLTLDHPRIVGCLDHGRTEGRAFVALRWVDGAPLSRVLARGPLVPRVALGCGFQALEALEYLHRKGVVHQDVKPDNLLVDRRGRCTLIDFGLARTRRDALLDRARGGVVRIAGSASYRAPEQEAGREVGPPADIYAFAVTLHRLLTGQLPPNGEIDAGLTATLRDALRLALDPEPGARPTAQTLRRALEA